MRSPVPAVVSLAAAVRGRGVASGCRLVVRAAHGDAQCENNRDGGSRDAAASTAVASVDHEERSLLKKAANDFRDGSLLRQVVPVLEWASELRL